MSYPTYDNFISAVDGRIRHVVIGPDGQRHVLRGKDEYPQNSDVWRCFAISNSGNDIKYFVSQRGNFKSLRKMANGRLRERKIRTDGHTSNGYKNVIAAVRHWESRNGRWTNQTTYSCHVVVAKYFLYQEDGKNEVDHIVNRDENGDYICNNNVTNLRWVNHVENSANRMFWGKQVYCPACGADIILDKVKINERWYIGHG